MVVSPRRADSGAGPIRSVTVSVVALVRTIVNTPSVWLYRIKSLPAVMVSTVVVLVPGAIVA